MVEWGVHTGAEPGVDTPAVGSWQACLPKRFVTEVTEVESSAVWVWFLIKDALPLPNVKNRDQTLWVPMSASGNHRAFSVSRTYCHKIRNNKENYQMLFFFYSRENQVSSAKLAVIFSFCISLKRHTREIILHSCLSCENVYALWVSSPINLFDHRFLITF